MATWTSGSEPPSETQRQREAIDLSACVGLTTGECWENYIVAVEAFAGEGKLGRGTQSITSSSRSSWDANKH